MEILQARILEWIAMASSRGSSQPRDWTQISHITGRFLTNRATKKAHEYSSGEPNPSPGDLPNPGELGFPHCRWIPYQLSYQGSPIPRTPSFSFTINQLEKDHTSCRLPPKFTYKNSSKKTIREFEPFELEPCPPCWATEINLSLHQTSIFQFLCPHCVSRTCTRFWRHHFFF